MKKISKYFLAVITIFLLIGGIGLLRSNYSYAENRWDYPELKSEDGRFYYYVNDENEATLCSYSGNDENLMIPSWVDGYKVKGIYAEFITYSPTIKTIYIPNTIREIGTKAFYDCSKLEYITVESDNPYYTSCDGILYTKDKTKLLNCPAKKDGPIILEDGLKEIDTWAFKGCINLKRLVLPNTVEKIGGQAFSQSNLEVITMPSSIKFIDTGFVADEWDDDFGYIFKDCSNIKEIWLKKYSYVYSLLRDKYPKEIKIIDKLSTLDISQENYPTTIEKGNTFTLYGKITSNYNLSSVVVQVLDKNNSVVKSASKIVYPKGKIFSDIDKGIKFGTLPIGEYKYQVIAADVSGNRKVLIDKNFKVVNQSASVSQITGLKYINTSSSIKLTWTKSSSATGYEVWIYNSSKDNYIKAKTITNKNITSYTRQNITSATVYKFKVRAYRIVNGIKYYGDFTDEFTTVTKPLTPNLKIISGSKKATLKWSNTSKGSTGYQIYRATSKYSSYKKIKTTNLKSFTNTDLTKGKYYYKVRAYKTLNDGTIVYGSFSSVKSVKIK